MKVKAKDIFQVVLFTGIGAIILWLLWRSQSAAYTEQCLIDNIPPEDCNLVKKLLSDFKSSNPFWIITVCIIYMLGNVCRALRWQQLLKPLGIRVKFYNSFFSVMAVYLFNLGIPRSGEFARAGLLCKYEDLKVESVFGTIIMDRILDFLSLFVMLSLGFLLAFNTLWSFVQSIAPNFVNDLLFYGVLIMILGAFGLLALFYFLKRTSGSSHPLLSRVHEMVSTLVNGMKSIMKVENLPLFIIYSIGIWLSYYLMTYLMFYAFQSTSHLGPVDGLLVFDFGALGIIFPSPGGMGAYHAMIMEALHILGIDKVNGFSFAMILFFTINVFCNIFFGLLGLILLPILNAKK